METLYSLSGGAVEAIEFDVPEGFKFVDTPIKNWKIKNNILIGAILHQNIASIPTGEDTVTVGDRIIVISSGHRLLALSDIVR